MKTKAILKSLFVLGALFLSGSKLTNNTHYAKAENEDMSTLVSKYYNEGIYTKKSNIYVNNETTNEITQYFHGKVALDRTTYYNGNQLYIRVDYVRKLSVYKIVWFDLNYIDVKHLDLYVNMQMMTKFMADRLINIMLSNKYESGYLEDDNILGDRVEVGCNSVICPGTIIYPDTNIYPLTRVRGVIGPKKIVKDTSVIVEKEDR